MISKILLTLGIGVGETLFLSNDNFALIMISIFLFIIILLMVELWIIFKKTGRPGWHAIIPIYNIWSMYEIAGIKGWFGWMAILSIVPIVGPLFTIIFTVILYSKLVKTFGKNTIFTIGLIFLSPIFYGILAFSKKSVYIGIDNNQDYEQFDYETEHYSLMNSNIGDDNIYIKRLSEISEQISKLEYEKQEIMSLLNNMSMIKK